MSARAIAAVETSAPRPKRGQEAEVFEVEGLQPLLPEEWFDAVFVDHHTRVAFRVPKLVMTFEIKSHGPYERVQLQRTWRVKALKGDAGKRGRFVLGGRSDLYVTMVRLLDLKLRPDRVSFHDLRRLLFRIRPRTVKTDYDHQKLPEQHWYSVVGEIERQD